MLRTLIPFMLFTSLSLFGQVNDPARFVLGADDLTHDTLSGKIEITTASRNSKFLEELPVTVHVITREEILENGYTTLVDALKDIPGIKVSQPGSGLEGESFLMNGMYGNYYCKILVNGIPITPSVASGTAIAGNLPVRQAKRIEIISGPAAALYGSDALAGVINIITMESDRPVWTQADLSVGSQGYSNMNVMIGGKLGKNKNVAEYSLYGNYTQKMDMNVKYDIPGNYDPSLYNDSAYNAPNYRGSKTEPQFDRLPMSSNLLGFGLTYRGIKANYDHLSRRAHSSIGQSTGQFAYYDPTNTWGENINRLSLSYNNSWGKFSSTTQLSYLNYRLDNNSSLRMINDRGSNGVVYQYAASDDIFFDEIMTFDVNKHLELSGGFSFQASSNLPMTNELPEPFETDNYQPFSSETIEGDTLMGTFGYNPTNFYNTAVFLQLYYAFGKFTLLAGGRWDHHSIFGSNLSPKLGLQYSANSKLSFRANYGQGFRAPSLFYVYKSLAYPVDDKILYETIPNPDVNPEKFVAVELGARFKPSKKIGIDFVLQYHKLDDNITYSLIDVDPEKYPNALISWAFAVVNDGNSESELYSGQIQVRAKNIVPSIKLNSRIYLTLSKGSEILPNDFGKLNDYRNMPNWMVQWNLDLKLVNKWVIILNNTFSDGWEKRFFPLSIEDMDERDIPTSVDGFYTLDMTNRFMINRNFHAFLIINNVFNTHYGGIDAYGGLYDLRYNPQYGRNFRLGFSFTME